MRDMTIPPAASIIIDIVPGSEVGVASSVGAACTANTRKIVSSCTSGVREM